MGLETAVSQRGKKSVSASCGQVSSRPSGNIQVVVKEKVDYFISRGCRGTEGRRVSPSEDLKISAKPLLPPAFYLVGPHASLQFFHFQITAVGLWHVT